MYGLKDFIFASKVLKLYRSFLKRAYKLEDPGSRKGLLLYVKPRFKKLQKSQDKEYEFLFVKSEIEKVMEMLNMTK